MQQFTQFHCSICIMLWCKETASNIRMQRSNHQLIHRIITIDNIIYALNYNSFRFFFSFLFLQVISLYIFLLLLLKIVARKYMFVDYTIRWLPYFGLTFLSESKWNKRRIRMKRRKRRKESGQLVTLLNRSCISFSEGYNFIWCFRRVLMIAFRSDRWMVVFSLHI